MTNHYCRKTCTILSRAGIVIPDTMDRKVKRVLFLMAACALGLSVAAHVFAVFPFDIRISHELQEMKNPVLAQVMQDVSILGETWIAVILIGSVSVFFVIRRQFLKAGFVPATASNFVLTSVLKVLVARPRPPDFSPEPCGYVPPRQPVQFPKRTCPLFCGLLWFHRVPGMAF